ncbi:MAG: Zn-ribbon domain-containing OB-fold protein [Pseudomonadales bacterium]
MSNSVLDKEFQAGCEQRELRLQQCSVCNNVQFYPRIMCTECGDDKLDWKVASGEGIVASFTKVRQAIDPKFKDLLPYVVALVDLQEGPRMMAAIIDADVDTLQIGDSVNLDFMPWGDEALRPVFKTSGKS